MTTGDPGAGTARERWSGSERSSPTLRQRYQWYLERQTAELLSLLSREALRDLYGHARAWAAARGEHERKDPMATLRRFCSKILPLPPFPVWAEDFRRNRGHYLYDDLEPPTDSNTDPVAVEVRSLTVRGRPWTVELRLYHAEAAWRGFMVFREASGGAHSTADIFCEDAPGLIRDRFLGFESDTLQAFLRSTLP